MDKLKTISTGGFPFVLDDIRQFLGRLSGSQGIYQAFNNLLRGFGDNFIVQGVVASGSSPSVAITEGWVLLNGELIKVDAQTGINTTTNNKFVKVTTLVSDIFGNAFNNLLRLVFVFAKIILAFMRTHFSMNFSMLS